MTEQLRLDGMPEAPEKPWRGGYARPPGSGPAGETCGTCAHFRRREYHDKTYFKCGLVLVTFGPGTDIRKSAPACARWMAVPEPSPDAPRGEG